MTEYKPSIVGFSLRNLDIASFSDQEDTDFTFLELLKKFGDECRTTSPETIIALGGSGFSIAPKLVLNMVKVDIGFVGPCEYDFAAFCHRYLKRSDGKITDFDIDGIPSIIHPSSESIPIAGKLAPKLTESNTVFLTEGIEIAKVVGGTIPVRTKTGCSLRCSYCVVPFIEPLHERPLTNVIKELRQIASMGLGDRIFIADGEFNLPSKTRAIELCKEIHLNFGDTLQWRCYVCPSAVDEDLVKWMKKAGCIWVSLTVDAYDNAALRGMGKGHTEEQSIEATKLFLNYGIELNLNILFGGPGETTESIAKTLDRCKWAVEIGAHLSPIFGLRIYPGTPLYNQAMKLENKEFVKWGTKYPFLGHYCQPVNKNELSDIFENIFTKSNSIHHAKSETLDEDPNVELARAFNLHLLGESDNALIRLKNIYLRRPNCSRTALALVKVLYSNGEVNEAVELLENINH